MTPTKSKRPATARPVGEPLKSEHIGQHREFKDSKSRIRFQRLVRQLHALGPKPLFHFLDELDRGADLRATLETYAALPVDLIKAYHGDEFMPSLVPIRAGRCDD